MKKNYYTGEFEQLNSYDFKEERYYYKKVVGALTISINKETKEITGCGFWPVSFRIFSTEIKDLIEAGLVEERDE